MAETPGLSRREALKRGAVLGAAVWAVPTVQALSINSASADSPSGSSKVKDKDKGKGKG